MSRSGRAVRNLLVVGEVALAVVVLIGAGLLMRSFAHLRSANPGFQPSGLLTARLPLAGGRNAAAPRRVEFFGRPSGRQVPRFRGFTTRERSIRCRSPASAWVSTFAVDGRPAPPPDQRPIGLMRAVTDSYFRTMGIRLLAGREFSAPDTSQSPPVVIVNRTLARRFWPGTSGPAAALGGRLVLDQPNGRVAEIVGVVSDVKAGQDRRRGLAHHLQPVPAGPRRHHDRWWFVRPGLRSPWRRSCSGKCTASTRINRWRMSGRWKTWWTARSPNRGSTRRCWQSSR